MRKGGRYIVEKPGQKPKRVEWTRPPAGSAEAAESAAPAPRQKPAGGATSGGAKAGGTDK